MSKDPKARPDHERTDWNLKIVIWSFAILVASVIVLLAVSWWIFRDFHFIAGSRQIGTVRGAESLPPEPRLQVSPDRDWLEMFHQEQEFLNSYGWIDRNQGTVHIPIEKAMEIVAQRGVSSGQRGGNAK